MDVKISKKATSKKIPEMGLGDLEGLQIPIPFKRIVDVMVTMHASNLVERGYKLVLQSNQSL